VFRWTILLLRIMSTGEPHPLKPHAVIITDHCRVILIVYVVMSYVEWVWIVWDDWDHVIFIKII